MKWLDILTQEKTNMAKSELINKITASQEQMF